MRRWISFFSLAFFLVISPLPTFASIIKKPPVKTGEVAYKDLICTEEQKTYIYEIISTMGESSKLSLLLKQTHLKALGDQISEVHPMKFLETIFTDPHLKNCMLSIWGDYFKRSHLLENLSLHLSREMEKGKLMALIPDFGRAIGIPAENLQSYFENQDWENLVLFLIQS